MKEEDYIEESSVDSKGNSIVKGDDQDMIMKNTLRHDVSNISDSGSDITVKKGEEDDQV